MQWIDHKGTLILRLTELKSVQVPPIMVPKSHFKTFVKTFLKLLLFPFFNLFSYFSFTLLNYSGEETIGGNMVAKFVPNFIDIFILGNVDIKNPKEKSGWTPLHDAALNGYQDVCRFIVQNVADKNPKDDTGNTPLHEAASVGHLNAFRYGTYLFNFCKQIIFFRIIIQAQTTISHCYF